MKAHEQDIKALMMKSLDESLSIDEQIKLDETLNSSQEMQKEYQELRQMRHLLEHYEVPDDALWSDQEILDFIPVTRSQNGARIFLLGRYWSKIAVACAIAFMVSLGSVYFQNGSLDGDTLVGIDEINADEAYTYLSSNYTYNE
jgi:hypothetical protein